MDDPRNPIGRTARSRRDRQIAFQIVFCASQRTRRPPRLRFLTAAAVGGDAIRLISLTSAFSLQHSAFLSRAVHPLRSHEHNQIAPPGARQRLSNRVGKISKSDESPATGDERLAGDVNLLGGHGISRTDTIRRGGGDQWIDAMQMVQIGKREGVATVDVRPRRPRTAYTTTSPRCGSIAATSSVAAGCRDGRRYRRGPSGHRHRIDPSAAAAASATR